MSRALTCALAVLALGCSTGNASGEPEASIKASLHVVRQTPLTIRGRDFRSSERVRVSAAGQTRVLRANPRGVFVLVLGATVDRCNSVRILAVGSGGSRAILKILPSPMCAPARVP